MDEKETNSTPPPQTPPAKSSQNSNSGPHKRGLNISHILVGSGIGLILLVAGFWFYTFLYPIKSVDNSPIKVSTSSAKTATSSAQKANTKNWKTYTSTVIGMSIKYPSDFLFKENDTETVTFWPKNAPKTTGQEGVVPVTGITFYKRNPNSLDYTNNEKTENTTVAGYQTIRIVGYGQYDEWIFIISNDKKKAVKVFYGTSALSGSQRQEVFDLYKNVLSTFKFLP